jgi:hypothetical protein
MTRVTASTTQQSPKQHLFFKLNIPKIPDKNFDTVQSAVLFYQLHRSPIYSILTQKVYLKLFLYYNILILENIKQWNTF